MREYNIEVIQLDDDNEDLNEPPIDNYLFYAKNEDDALEQFHKTVKNYSFRYDAFVTEVY